MKIRLTEWFNDWGHPEPQRPKPTILDLEEQKLLFYLAISLGNGNYDAARFETDSLDAYQFVIDLLTGTAGASLVQSDEVNRRSALYCDGYEIYRQGQDAYFFVDPHPRLELFATQKLAL